MVLQIFLFRFEKFKTSRTVSKINYIFRFLSGVDDDFDVLTGAGVLDEILDSLHMP